MKDSKIEWTNHTANLWIGCVEVHEGCDNCYARVLNHRWGHENWGKDTPRRAVKKVWGDLAKWQKEGKAANRIDRVFVGSMMDIFEKPMPVINSKGELQNYDTGYIRDEFFNNVVPDCPNLIFLLLTKRPGNINRFIPEAWKTNPPSNVMFGTSPVNQQTADKLIRELLEVNGRKFLSVEPQLERIDLFNHLWTTCDKCGGSGSIPVDGGGKACGKCLNPYQGFIRKPAFDWVICGGESGHGKRFFDVSWARQLKMECKDAAVPFFMKQIDKIQPIPADLMIRQFPN